MTSEEITMESGIPESLFLHDLTEVLKRKVTAFSMTMQDISHKLYRLFSPITSGKQYLTLVTVLILVLLISNSFQS
jgi:hypothetical protein